MFPTIDESRLPGLKHHLIQTCQEVKVPYHTFRYTDLLAGTFRSFMKRDKTAPCYPTPHPSVSKALEAKTQ